MANLTFVTSSMIASTLLTSGVENCNVVAASPIEVSGSRSIDRNYDGLRSASGREVKIRRRPQPEELVTTGELANEVGQQGSHRSYERSETRRHRRRP